MFCCMGLSLSTDHTYVVHKRIIHFGALFLISGSHHPRSPFQYDANTSIAVIMHMVYQSSVTRVSCCYLPSSKGKQGVVMAANFILGTWEVNKSLKPCVTKLIPFLDRSVIRKESLNVCTVVVLTSRKMTQTCLTLL